MHSIKNNCSLEKTSFIYTERKNVNSTKTFTRCFWFFIPIILTTKHFCWTVYHNLTYTSLDSGFEGCFPWRPVTSERAFRNSSFSRLKANTSPSLIVRQEPKEIKQELSQETAWKKKYEPTHKKNEVEDQWSLCHVTRYSFNYVNEREVKLWNLNWNK